jgi:hypothetical protein
VYDDHADYGGGGNFEEREDVQELNYGADNRMAKSASIGQV